MSKPIQGSMRHVQFIDSNIPHTYIVVHEEGLGVMECPMEYRGIMSSYETLEEAEQEAERLKWENNPPNLIASSWYTNHYYVRVNKNTEKGRYLYEQHEKDIKEYFEYAEKHLNKRQCGDFTIYSSVEFDRALTNENSFSFKGEGFIIPMGDGESKSV